MLRRSISGGRNGQDGGSKGLPLENQRSTFVVKASLDKSCADAEFIRQQIHADCDLQSFPFLGHSQHL